MLPFLGVTEEPIRVVTSVRYSLVYWHSIHALHGLESVPIPRGSNGCTYYPTPLFILTH